MSTFEVIVPCYNYGRYLLQCVHSVLGQSMPDVSVVIVNDASPDDTAAIADALARQDPRVSVIHHATNRGHIASYNEVLVRTRSEFTMVLSADDVLSAGSLERAVKAFRMFPQAGLCYGPDIPFESQLPAADIRADAAVTFRDYMSFFEASCALGHTPVQAASAMMRTSVQRKVGLFLPSLPQTGDTEIWLRIAAEGGVARVETIQAYRRVHATNLSKSYSPVQRVWEQQRAFDVHFATAPLDDRDRVRLRRQVYRTCGEQSFWVGARAFETGDKKLLDEALGYAVCVYPEIVRTRDYQRLRVKRALGIRMWSAVKPWLPALAGGDAARTTKPAAG